MLGQIFVCSFITLFFLDISGHFVGRSLGPFSEPFPIFLVHCILFTKCFQYVTLLLSRTDLCCYFASLLNANCSGAPISQSIASHVPIKSLSNVSTIFFLAKALLLIFYYLYFLELLLPWKQNIFGINSLKLSIAFPLIFLFASLVLNQTCWILFYFVDLLDLTLPPGWQLSSTFLLLS